MIIVSEAEKGLDGKRPWGVVEVRGGEGSF
jgi:hypothetical protein